MMLHIPNVLTPEQVARCKEVMTKAAWVDGNVTVMAANLVEKVTKMAGAESVVVLATTLGLLCLPALAHATAWARRAASRKGTLRHA